MAWDSRRRRVADPPPWYAKNRQKFGSEALFNLSNNFTTDDARMGLGTLLPPIEEESQFSLSDTPLEVNVTVRFWDPVIRSTYYRNYGSSTAFVPSDRICRGLLRRIEHCSVELITRKDRDALNSAHCLRQSPKPLRFEMVFQISRRNAGIFAERSFESYQKQPLNTATANEVLRSTHMMVGMFLRRHDEAFELTDEPAREYFPEEPVTVRPSKDSPPTLLPVPLSRFIESSQTWEFIPGYTVELSFKCRNHNRHESEFTRTVRVSSTQSAPLTLGLGEDLLWQTSKSVHDALDSRKDAFDIDHANCDAFEGPFESCQHFNDDALDVELSIVNNLGPAYDHLHRSTRSKMMLFKRVQDCEDFVRKVHLRLQQSRDRIDEKLKALNDFDLRIVELQGQGWLAKNPARFVLDASQTYSRRNIEAILDRVQTSVSDVLRGNDMAIHLVGFKRGHIVLDKALIARKDLSASTKANSRSPAGEQNDFIARLTDQIRKDLDLICRDTCNIDDLPEEVPKVTSRPATPAATQHAQTATPTQSPSRTAVRPQMPPSMPSVPRAFPLVPSKFKERPVVSTSSIRDFATVMEPEPVHHIIRNILEVEAHTDSLQDRVTELKTPEPIRKAAKFEAFTSGDDNDSLRSSTPSLSDGETPSPEHNMLRTPSFTRSASDIKHHLLKDSSNLSVFIETPEIGDSEFFGVQDKLSGSEVGIPPITHESEATSLDRRDPDCGYDHRIFDLVSEDNISLESHDIKLSDLEDNNLQMTNGKHVIFGDDAHKPSDIFGDMHSDVNEPKTAESESSEDSSFSTTPESPRTSIDDGELEHALPDDVHKSPNDESPLETGDTHLHVDSEGHPDISSEFRSESELFPITESKISDVALQSERWLGSDRTRPLQDDLSRSKVYFFEAKEVDAEAKVPAAPQGPNISERNDELVPVQVPEGFGVVSKPVMQVANDDSLEAYNTFETNRPQPFPTDTTSEPPDLERVGGNRLSRSIGVDNVDNSPEKSAGFLQLIRLNDDAECSIFRSSELIASGPAFEPKPNSNLSTSLLPSLPISTNKNSLSSDWESYISESRVSNDSVDTIISIDTVKPEEDTPNRLRTPTAGLLGLHESRWADFGLRGALIGSHQFDRPSTAPILSSNAGMELREEEAEEVVVAEASPKSPRKTVHLRHTKSKSSVVMAALKAHKLKRKKSSKMEIPVTKETQDDSVTAMPRAMFLFAGLALASQVVNKSL